MANGALNVYKHYVPSVGAAVAFTIIFGALTIAHTIFIILRKRCFPTIVVIGGICKLSSLRSEYKLMENQLNSLGTQLESTQNHTPTKSPHSPSK